MSATYPLALKTFTTKRDNVDTVWADDVNTLQDEVAALETVLGVNPNIDATLVNPVTQWDTVAERLAYMQRSQDTPCWDLYRHETQYFTDNTNAHALKRVTFTRALADTHNLFNGSTGVVIKRPGFYFLGALGCFADAEFSGERSLTICRNDNSQARASAEVNSNSSNYSEEVWLSTHWCGFLYANDVISVNADIWTGGGSQQFSVTDVHLSGFLVRDL